jgi:hypothetical protein
MKTAAAGKSDKTGIQEEKSLCPEIYGGENGCHMI